MQGDPADAPVTDGPPRALLIAAVLVPVVAIGVVLAMAASLSTPPAPVAIAALPAAQASTPECQGLLAALPDRLGDYQRAATADPTPAGAAAWRGDGEPGTEPVIMRCGLDRPAEFVIGAQIQMVDQVSWFRLADPDTGRSTWVCVDRPVYVALTLPDGSGPTTIQTLSEAIERTLPATPIRPGQP